MLATIRQVLYRRHVNGIRLLTVLLAIIRDGKSRTIDNDIRTDMVEQGLHLGLVVARDKHRAAAVALHADQPCNHVHTINVKRVRWLVKNQQLGRLHDRLRQ